MRDETSRETRVSHGLVGKVCGGRRNSESFGREAHSVPYILCTYRASLVSNVSRDRACETRPRSRGLVSRLVLQGLAARRNSIKYYISRQWHMKIQAWGDVVFPADNPKNYCTSFKKYQIPSKIHKMFVCIYVGFNIFSNFG